MSDDLDAKWFQSRVKLSRVPVNSDSHYTFKNFELVPGTESAVYAVKAFTGPNRPHHFLSLVGEPGRGKSHLSYAIVWFYLKHFKPEGELKGTQKCKRVLYYQVEDLMDELRRGFDKDTDPGAYDKLMNTVKTVDILVLDDMGTETKTEWTVAKMNQIVDHRYLHEMPTVFTGNLEKEGVEPRISSRMAEGVMVLLKCSDYREKIAAARGKK